MTDVLDRAGDKRMLRVRFLQQRREMGAAACEDADARIAARVLQLPQWQEATLVLSYLGVGDEVATAGLIEAALARGNRVALPRVIAGTRELEWRLIPGGRVDEGLLERSGFGVLEPRIDGCPLLDAADIDSASIALVPGLAFTRDGFRLGYGGGFYDRFLATFPGVSVGLVRSAFLLEPGALPLDAHDRRVDIVVSD